MIRNTILRTLKMSELEELVSESEINIVEINMTFIVS